MQSTRPAKLIDPVCGMNVDVERAEAHGLLLEHQGRTYAFCRAGCRRAFVDEPETYISRAETTEAGDAAESAGSAERMPAASGTRGLPVIDEGMRRWYKSCSCCLSDAYPDVKARLDAELAGSATPPVEPGICEVAEATTS